jgi:hypothetical protein
MLANAFYPKADSARLCEPSFPVFKNVVERGHPQIVTLTECGKRPIPDGHYLMVDFISGAISRIIAWIHAIL